MSFFFLSRPMSRWAIGLACVVASSVAHGAEQTNFGLNLSGGKEPVRIEADGMEMRDKEGLAIFTGHVSVAQGDRIMRAGKMIVYYSKSANGAAKPGQRTGGGLGSTGVDRMEASGKVYVKAGNQVATGERGVFDGKSNIMVLSGSKVVLTDGDNVASGCRLTAHMDTGKAFLESCSSPRKKGRVSIIMNPNEQN